MIKWCLLWLGLWLLFLLKPCSVGRFYLKSEFKVEDFWLGVFWRDDREEVPVDKHIWIWIIGVPCFPIRVTIRFYPERWHG